MNKMSEMAMTIEELRNAAAAITDAANYGDAFTLVFYIIYHPALLVLHFLYSVGLAVSFIG